LRDIQAAFGSPDFWRMRIGIGHPRSLGLAQQVAAFVLNNPRQDELRDIEDVITRCRAVMPALLRGDVEQATRQLHATQKA
ncbi:MAG: aminoacyl-tRNA hydrolase, partial [Alcaligenes sp.]